MGAFGGGPGDDLLIHTGADTSSSGLAAVTDWLIGTKGKDSSPLSPESTPLAGLEHNRSAADWATTTVDGPSDGDISSRGRARESNASSDPAGLTSSPVTAVPNSLSVMEQTTPHRNGTNAKR
jgi:hypothetical protein